MARRFALFRDPVEAVKGADAVYTDVWTSMGQETEAAERKHAFAGYQVTSELMRHAARSCRVHALPSCASERRSRDRSVRIASVSRVRSGREPLHSQKALLLTLMANRTGT